MSLKYAFLLVFFTLLTACTDDPPAEPDEESVSLAELVDKSELSDGYFKVLRDKDSGTTHLVIRPDQLDKEFIHHVVIRNGVVQAGHFRGAYGVGRVLKLQRHFERIDFVLQNTHYYFDPENPLSKAADANVPPAILATQEIVTEDEESGELVIALEEVLLAEKLVQIKPTPDPDASPKDGFTLGKLSEHRNKILSVRSYPENTVLVTEYVYENPAPVVPGGEDVTDSRSVSVQVQHTFLAMPENDFQPRRDDYRVGFFLDRVTDLTDTGYTPFRDVINRWRLVKKDPDAALSEPQEPITWWIENTTPLEYRDLVRDAVLAWNAAFEKAGFKNAIVVEVQPDDAEWDAGDLRYNVLRWTSSPTPLFGGYGPSFTNPRTGQILGADIMLEFAYLRNHRRAQELLQPSARLEGHVAGTNPRYCNVGASIQDATLFAREALELFGSEAQQQQLLRDSMFNLILHEVGHALGLMHNMRASQIIADPFDPAQVEKLGLTGSVMDYADINFAPPGKTQTLYYQIEPGPYDEWAIEYGYSQAVSDPSEEEARLDAILARASDPALAFGNDGDDMRLPDYGIDPRININDLSSDAVGYAIGGFELLRTVAPQLKNNFAERYPSWQALVETYGRLVRRHGALAQVVASYVGGVHIERQPTHEQVSRPYVPVPLEQQQRAMQALAKYVFAPDAMVGADELYAHLQTQRRDFDFYGQSEDPKLHAAWGLNQTMVLDRLLHPVTLGRITDARLYGNKYSAAQVMSDLTTAIFDADRSGDVNTLRQNLQIEYVNRLAGLLEPDKAVDNVARSAALYQLKQIEDLLDSKRRGDLDTKAHTQHVLLLIARALEVS